MAIPNKIFDTERKSKRTLSLFVTIRQQNQKNKRTENPCAISYRYPNPQFRKATFLFPKENEEKNIST
jgi:hypothetical protein